ncbi:protein NRT1/ PTR FAMILY 2.7-like isoform X2 [Henckelia pumila]|uniref:protein NRT1/ PTR FAMILY 2.7-like isoform X2 n=1 Tax=Henckelia pumila TaxID=405737 RepID=UPI003C6E289E
MRNIDMAAALGDNSTLTGDGEAPSPSTAYGRKRGGWKSTLFILAALAGSALASSGWLSNLIVFLIEEFNIKSIDAAQISNVIAGSTCFFPVIAAIVADSFLGCFTVIWISSLISVTGLILMVLTAKLDVLRPQPCEHTRSICPTPTTTQYAVLYSALALLSIGLGGTRFTMASMGANQFTEPKNQAVYFNWYFVTLYISSVIASTGIVYVEDRVSWAWGFCICLVANVFGLAMFLLGSRYYYEDKPEGSPFTSLARVIVASVRKIKKSVASFETEDYYCGDGGVEGMVPSKSFRILNRAAIKTEGDILPNGRVAKPWKICTVQELEDLKCIIRIIPLWSTSIFLGTPIGIQASLSVLQALNMDRNLSRHFQVPAGSIMVVPFVSTAICLSVFDRYISPLWKKIRGKNLTPLQQIGLGHVINTASMAVSALVESKRRHVAAHSLQPQVRADAHCCRFKHSSGAVSCLVGSTTSNSWHRGGLSFSRTSCIVLSRIPRFPQKHELCNECDAYWDCLLFEHCCHRFPEKSDTMVARQY